MAFTQKLLRFTVALADGSQVVFSGLRSTCTIIQGGNADLGGAEITIYGLTLSDMNKISTLGVLIQWVRRNVITVEAGDTTSGMGVVYQGNILNGWADFQAMPNNSFRISARAGLFAAVQPITPTTINNANADVATLMNGLAVQGGFHFENTGVQVQISYPYLSGTILNQIDTLAKAANINYTIDSNNTLAIWPRNSQRGSQIPVVSEQTGMIGMPTFNSLGVQVDTMYNPSITFGQFVQVQSSVVPAANKTWAISSLTHELSSMLQGGPWRTRFIGVPTDLFVISPPIT